MFKFKLIKKKETESQRKYVEKEVKKIPSIVSIIFLIYVIIFICFMIWYFTFRSTYYISDVEGPSMKPTINTGVSDYDANSKEDLVYVNRKKEVEHGDVVIVNINTTGDKNQDKFIIKRVIATEGDKFSIYISDDGYFHVHIQYAGTEDVISLQEEYIKGYDDWTRNKSAYIKSSIYYENDFYNTFITSENEQRITVIDGVYFYEVPENNYLCLGDNRAVSLDSRVRGTFVRTQIQGVAEIIVKDGCNMSGIRLFFRKVGSIWGFYWKEIEKMFAR